MNMKLGSLFDGIGTFPLSGLKYGFIPVWASEIEPFPIRVTQQHFPDMKHLGDITKVSGAEIEPVDVITFGSPCQDMSVAGKREGLAGARSGLFMEAVRIIREMRRSTGGQYPRFAVWENVPGAYSSNSGQDFRAVLEEIAETEIPMPPSGKWGGAGMVRTERVDIAWRTLDAQYWGVPQRRKRISLVTDFGGQCAGEILFIEEGLRGDIAESGEAREETAATIRDGTTTPIWDIGDRRRVLESINVAPSLLSKMGTGGNNVPIIPALLYGFLPNQGVKAQGMGFEEEKSPTLRTGAVVGVVMSVIGFDNQTGQSEGIEVSPSVRSESHGSLPCVASYWDGGQVSDCIDCSMLAKGQMMPEKRRFPVVIEPRSADGVCRVHEDGILPTLNTAQGGQRQPCICVQNATRGKSQNGLGVSKDDVSYTLDSLGNHAVAYPDPANTLLAKSNSSHRGDTDNIVISHYAVRRLTPLECERLQGLPDGWTDIEGASDTARYKAIGNGIAKPCFDFVLQGIARILKRGRPCQLNE